MHQALLFVQGIYFILTGTWPLVHLESFERVSGRKTDKWLVQAFGLLTAASGIVLLIAARSDPTNAFAILLATLDAAVLCFVDFYFVARKQIPKVYLVDGFVEAVFFILWLIQGR